MHLKEKPNASHSRAWWASIGKLEDDHGIALPYFNALVVQLLKKLRIQQTNSRAYPSKEN